MWKIMNKNIKNDITAINPLNTICKFMGILPWINLNDYSHFKTLHFLPITMVIVIISLYVTTTKGKIIYLYQEVGISAQITDLLVDFSLLVTNITGLIGLNLWHGKRVFKFLVNLQKLDEEFKSFKINSKYPNLKFYTEFVLIHVFLVLHVIMNITLWFNTMDFFVYQHFLLRDLQYYFVILQVMLLRHYGLLMNYRFELLNKMFLNLSIRGCKAAGVQKDPSQNRWSVRKVNEIYGRLSDIVEAYNKIFGWQFFLMYIHILVILLLPINMCFVYGDGVKDIRGVHFGPQFVIICLVWFALSVILSFAIFSVGVSEAQRTSTIAYKLLRELPSNEKFFYIRNEIFELAQFSSTKCPEISAAGFFTVNFKTLFSLYGSVTSYVIVLLQYSK